MPTPDFNGKILLLANYLPDRQESMQRFADMLLRGLQSRNIAVEIIRPEPLFGRFLPTARGFGKFLAYIDKFILFPNRLRRARKNLLLHICDHSNGLYAPADLVTCHDLLAIRSALGEFPQNQTRATGRLYQQKILAGLNNARRVACVSNATAADLQRLSQLRADQITVIPNGLNYPYTPSDAPRQNRFILHVGGNQWYKNRAGVISIYRELLSINPNAPDLLLVGKELPRELQSQVPPNRVQCLHDCDNEKLRTLYSTAEALLFPSLAEGFGWPIIEAQACGCPVITSNRAPMTEVASDAALFIDPTNPRAAAEAIRNFLNEPDSQKAARQKKSFTNTARFSPDAMVDRYIEEYCALSAPSAKSAVHI